MHKESDPSPGFLVEFGMRRPKAVLWAAAILTVIGAAMFVRLSVDTDPENMLPSDHPARQANAELEASFGTGDLVVLAVIDDNGLVADPTTQALVDLHQRIVDLDDVDGDRVVGIGSTGLDGSDAAALRDAVGENPLLAGTVLTRDATTASWFVPIDDPDAADEVASELEALAEKQPGLEGAETALAGLPLAQDAFGGQMFVQMAIFAPLAGLLVFALLWFSLRRLALVGPAMVLAVLSVVWTMGLLIGTGNTVHIMSSMIPIFLMPIAILDSVHVLSEFHDDIGASGDVRHTVRHVYGSLRRPLLFTTLTTAVGFGSLALADIPPVQVFGLFVAVGVVIAWLLTMVFLPAWLTLVDERRFGGVVESRGNMRTTRVLGSLGRLAVRRRAVVLGVFALTGLAAIPLATTIEINDNPVNWFRADHPVRQASEELNERLPGTFGADLVLAAPAGRLDDADVVAGVEALRERWEALEPVGNTIAYTQLPDLGASTTPLTASLITSDRTAADLRIFLSDGDNQSMQLVVDATEEALADGILPADVQTTWAGESHLNLVWQDEMVSGMLQAFLGTLAIVVVLLVLLLRSVRWAALAIAPVLWTITVVYGFIGLVGKSYDMPIAVLSTLVLGLGVDFAIHFVERFRSLRAQSGSTTEALAAFFGEPAHALTRNALVLAIGFTPLFLSSLTPYLVVGAFLASILLLSWVSSIVALPALVSFSDRGERTDSPDQTEPAGPREVAGFSPRG